MTLEFRRLSHRRRLAGAAAAVAAVTAAGMDVAVNVQGDVFVADTYDNRVVEVTIREVTPDGIISTVVNSASANGAAPPAGGESSGVAPTASKLNTPYGVAIDRSTDVLYIADTNNSEIAEVTGLVQSGTASSSTGAGPTAPANS